MKRIQVPPLKAEQLAELEGLYQKTDKPRYRTRAQMVLLSSEQGLKAEGIAQIVRESHITVLRWLKRYLSEGIEGLKDEPRPGRSAVVTEAYRKQLLRSCEEDREAWDWNIPRGHTTPVGLSGRRDWYSDLL